MESQKQQVVERLQQANNILVTVSNNPSVDQLAACIGLTLALNKLGKHATAVFSGVVPSTIEFLQPEHTIEKNTDSLRDFIIALDKSKADKLRYKVEDRMVKIFITPYKTSITNKDLEFSQGDFNVDVVLAIGVHAQTDLDQAITSHGRILHDATVMTLNVKPGGELGSVNWMDVGASSLSELGVQLINGVDQKLMDGQIATAFLTGIVAETDRFSNNKTSPQTMSISAELMSAGANQQLVATKLEEPAPVPQPAPAPISEVSSDKEVKTPVPAEPPKPDDGTIEIAHEAGDLPKIPSPELPPTDESNDVEQEQEPQPEEPQAPQIHIDEHGELLPFANQDTEAEKPTENTDEASLPPIEPLPGIKHEEKNARLLTDEPPLLNNSPLTANALPDDEDKPAADLSLPTVGLLNREPLPSQQNDPKPELSMPTPVTTPQFNNPGVSPVGSSPFAMPNNNGVKTLSQIEEDVQSPHVVSPTNNPFMQPAPTFNTPAPEAQNQPFMTAPAPQVVAPTQTPAPVAPVTQPAEDNTVDAARDAVAAAINSDPGSTVEPLQSLNAQPMGTPLHNETVMPAQSPDLPPVMGPMVNPSAPQQPVSFEPTPEAQTEHNSTTPPPVPPPMMPPTFPTPSN